MVGTMLFQHIKKKQKISRLRPEFSISITPSGFPKTYSVRKQYQQTYQTHI